MSGDRSPRTNESAGSQSGQTEEPEVENKNQNMANRFVFSMVGPPKKAGSLLTPVSDTVFDAISLQRFPWAVEDERTGDIS